MSFQTDTIPSFGFSMAMPGDMATVNRDIFAPDTQMSSPAPPPAAAPKKAAKPTPAKKTTTTKHKTTRKRTTKPRRAIPDVKAYIPEPEPTELDVVSGRGGRSNHHPGNKACWSEMLSRRTAYRACKTDTEKNEIAQQVVDFVYGRGGRYVQRDPETDRWFILPNKIALDKAKQGLRDRYVPDWARDGSPDTNKTEKPAPKKRAPKNQPKKTHSKKSPEQEQSAAAEDPPVPSLPLSSQPNDESALKLSAACSLDLFPLASLSNSLIAAESLYGVEELLRSSNGLALQGGTSGRSGWGGDWGEMFARGIDLGSGNGTIESV